MRTWLSFLTGIADELFELFSYVMGLHNGNEPDPEQEKQLAMAIVRKASDEAARREITRP